MNIPKLLSISLCFVSIAACGQESNTPLKVKEAFELKFPDIVAIDWEKESENEWEAEFKMNNIEYSANFLDDGTWKETEHEIEEEGVPQNIKNILKAEFPEYKIEEVEISETSTGMVYEFEMEKGENELKVVIDTNGKIVKKEVNDENEDEDDN